MIGSSHSYAKRLTQFYRGGRVSKPWSNYRWCRQVGDRVLPRYRPTTSWLHACRCAGRILFGALLLYFVKCIANLRSRSSLKRGIFSKPWGNGYRQDLSRSSRTRLAAFWMTTLGKFFRIDGCPTPADLILGLWTRYRPWRSLPMEPPYRNGTVQARFFLWVFQHH
jgi:hypothetical protein